MTAKTPPCYDQDDWVGYVWPQDYYELDNAINDRLTRSIANFVRDNGMDIWISQMSPDFRKSKYRLKPLPAVFWPGTRRMRTAGELNNLSQALFWNEGIHFANPHDQQLFLLAFPGFGVYDN